MMALLVVAVPLLAGCSNNTPEYAPGELVGCDSALFYSFGIAPRFGTDANGNGFPDVPNTAEYAQSGLAVTINAPLARLLPVGGTVEPNDEYYEWEIRGVPPTSSPTQEHRTTAPSVTVDVPEGMYNVSLMRGGNVNGQDITSHRLYCDLTFEDFLIVAMGDGFASGEGAPERGWQDAATCPRPAETLCTRWADDGSQAYADGDRYSIQEYTCSDSPSTPSGACADRPLQGGWGQECGNQREEDGFAFFDCTRYEIDSAGWGSDVGLDHHLAHRSTVSWPAQVALAIEAFDSKTSVTFVSVAASGATIDDGLLGPYTGVPGDPLAEDLDRSFPSQVDQVEALVGERTIDALFLSIGLEDAGYWNYLRAGLRSEVSARWEGSTEDAVEEAFGSGDWSSVETRLTEEADLFGPTGTAEYAWEQGWVARPLANVAGLDGLRNQKLPQLATAIEQHLEPETVYLMENPSPSNEAYDPYRATTGRRCDEIGNTLQPQEPNAEITDGELAPLMGYLFNPLKSALNDVAAANDWRYLGDMDRVFNGWGLCRGGGPDPSDYAGNPYSLSAGYEALDAWDRPDGSRWRTALAASMIQGPYDPDDAAAARQRSTGAFYFSETGHGAAARRAIAHLDLGPATPPGIYRTPAQLEADETDAERAHTTRDAVALGLNEGLAAERHPSVTDVGDGWVTGFNLYGTDRMMYRFEVACASLAVTVEVRPGAYGDRSHYWNLTEPYLRLFKGSPTSSGGIVEVIRTSDSSIARTLSAGTYYIGVTGRAVVTDGFLSGNTMYDPSLDGPDRSTAPAVAKDGAIGAFDLRVRTTQADGSDC